ncbi:MAG: prepilin-type N-terminal cleavage/methylation domain-containing protein [Candidatus Omnitrophota bacterium]
MTRARPAFTFIELMIASTIFVMLAAAVYMSFGVGVRSWRKIEESYRIRQEARYVSTFVARELRCAANSSLIAFEGDDSSISFCKTYNGLSRVRYEYDKELGSIQRILQSYRQYVAGEQSSVSTVATGISDLKFSYSFKKDGKLEWLDAWQSASGSLPFGVKIVSRFKPEGSGKSLEYSNTVIIPAGVIEEDGQ